MKIIYLLLIYISALASSITLQYEGELSFFGKVGEATLQYTNDGKNYHIKVSGNGTGIVGELTGNKQYIIESIGIVKENKLIPMQYIMRETSNDENKTKTYIFDYDNNKTLITQYKKENKKDFKFDVFKGKSQRTARLVEENSTKELEKVYPDDMVSVFFNKRNNLLYMKQGETKLIHALGSEDTQDGVVIRLIEKKDDKFIFSVRVEKDYLEGGAEDVTFVLDKNNILFETNVDGILFFGSAKVQRKSVDTKKAE